MDMKTITNFLSTKINLIILQCILYCVLGYILRDYSWQQCIIIFTILLGIQFITRLMGVAHGMMLHQFMVDGQYDMMKFIKKMKENNKDEKPN